MAIRSGFYNSVAGDKRKYFNEDMSRLIHLLINDGIFQNFENQFLVHPGNGLEVIVASGLGWFNNHWIYNDNDYVIKLGAAPIVTQYKRIDSIVIKMDDSLNVREGKILCIQGTPSEVPSPPRLVDSEDVHYHKLADVLVGANVTSIIASNITNYVGTTTTPFITGILETIDVTTLIDQWHDQFERWNSAEQQAFLDWATNEQNAFIDWFNRMKDQLTEDAAGRLQTEVDDVRGQIHTNLLNPQIGTTSIYGVTFTSNGDGTYTAKGTASNEIWFNFIGEKKPISYFGVKNDGTKYRFTGCSDGGSSTTYMVNIYTYTDETPEHLIYGYTEIGNGQTFSLGSTETQIGFGVRVKKNAVLDNVVFKPMLTTDLSADYDSFVKYSGSEERLNEQVAELHEKSKGLHTNIIPNGYHEATPAGLTVERLADDSYLVNGTATTSGFIVVFRGALTNDKIVKENKRYLLTNCSPLPNRVDMHFHMRKDANTNVRSAVVASGNISTIFDTFGMPSTWTNSIVFYNIPSGTSFNNVVLKPMITEDLTAERDYVPYSGDGRLNENVAALFDVFHPIGTLYESVNKNFDPNTAKGWHGTWERIKDRFVYACGDSGEPGELGGSNTHKITSSELPAHNHPIPALTGTATGGNHTHKTFAKATSYGRDWNPTGGQLTSSSTGEMYWNSDTSGSGNLSLTVTTNATNTSNNPTYNTPIDIRPAFIRAYIWKRVS